MNLANLTPAPWIVHTDEDESVYIPEKPGGFPMLLAELDSDPHATALEFAALARNAFDVMMRRGWGVQHYLDNTWKPFYRHPVPTRLTHLSWPDPFTALVEADAWYVENVENKQTK